MKDDDDATEKLDWKLLEKGLCNSVNTLAKREASWSASLPSLESAVDAIKAVAVIVRILARQSKPTFNVSLLFLPLIEKLQSEESTVLPLLQPHHLSGLQWAMDCFQVATQGEHAERYILPSQLQNALDALELPFRIRPGLLLNSSTIFEDNPTHEIVAQFVQQVDFQSDVIKTTSTNRIVPERRQTAWQGDANVAAFSYSGKSMRRQPWSPLVENVRDCLHHQTAHYYDGCLLNLYPDGESGMRYHIDPDQGTLWGYETAVVSIGATRKFAFRSTSNNENGSKPHVFVLFNGDVTEMFRDCQERYQHTVKTAEARAETASRVSLVFKKTLESMRSN